MQVSGLTRDVPIVTQITNIQIIRPGHSPVRLNTGSLKHCYWTITPSDKTNVRRNNIELNKLSNPCSPVTVILLKTSFRLTKICRCHCTFRVRLLPFPFVV